MRMCMKMRMGCVSSMQVGRDQRRMRYERIVTTQAVMDTVPRSTGASVTRRISPFEAELVVSRSESAPATMSAVTSCTTTTTTPLPYATEERDDFLRMSTTAHTRLVIRDPQAVRAAYVTWHGPQGEILGRAEAPRTSLAPSYSMPMLYA